MFSIRIFDIILSLLGLILLSPLLLIIILIIKFTSKGPVFFAQKRVGKNGKDFRVLKFRTMFTGISKTSLLTVGSRDSRITKEGFFLRKYKLDELPQLINVLAGQMSFVGPRPEVRKYVELYSEEQKRTLTVLPGITDYASIAFRNENDLLALAINPEDYYIKELIPRKIELNFKYINNQNLKEYFIIILKTIVTSVRGK